jgi:large subunit ribosomal protein L9
MKIILNEDVLNLGEEGDICDVADGYGRNYLLPKSLAVSHTKANLAMFEIRRDAIEKRKQEKRDAAKGLKERLEAEPIVIQRPAGETGKLFGSVTNASIVDELEKHGIVVERKRVDLPEHNLKMIGNYSIRIKLYDNEVANLKLTIEGLDKDGNRIEPKEAKKKQEEAAAAEAEAAAAAEAETAAGEEAEEAAAEVAADTVGTGEAEAGDTAVEEEAEEQEAAEEEPS